MFYEFLENYFIFYYYLIQDTFKLKKFKHIGVAVLSLVA